MIVMRVPRRLADCAWRRRGWLMPATLLALAPKCVLCLLAYTGLGLALGLGGPELCGVPAEPAGQWLLLLSVAGAFAIHRLISSAKR